MASQWQNFLRNLGEWRGSFTTIGADGSLRDSSPSVLTLASEDEDRLVRFGLKRWPAGTATVKDRRQSASPRTPHRSIRPASRLASGSTSARRDACVELGNHCIPCRNVATQVAPERL